MSSFLRCRLWVHHQGRLLHETLARRLREPLVDLGIHAHTAMLLQVGYTLEYIKLGFCLVYEDKHQIHVQLFNIHWTEHVSLLSSEAFDQ